MKQHIFRPALAVLVLSVLALSSVPASGAERFPRDLTLGATGSDVRDLQRELASAGRFSGEPTGYFGPRTRAAVSAWQSAAGISPASGYFGPKSRARMIASAPAAPAAMTTLTPAPPARPAASVSADPASPASGVLISNADSASARVPVLAVRIAAGGEEVRLSGVSFRKTGVVSDANILGAHLLVDGRVISTYRSISGGTVRFTDIGLVVPAGEARTVWLSVDPATGIPSGNMVGFSLSSADDIVLTAGSGDPLRAAGNFPVSGGTFTATAVSNPSLARLSVEAMPIAETLMPGTSDNIVAAWNFSLENGKAELRGLRLLALGDADKEEIRNLRVSVNGVFKGVALPEIPEDGDMLFDLSSAPVVLLPGHNRIEIRADITGSPGDELQLMIRAPYDIDIADATYRVPIAGQASEGTEVLIQPGTLIIRPL